MARSATSPTSCGRGSVPSPRPRAALDRLRKTILAGPRGVPALVARVTQFGPDAPADVVDHVLHLAAQTSSLVWTDGLADVVRMDFRHALARVTVPALVAVGDQDRVTPPAVAVELAAALPEGRLFIVEGAGHVAMWSDQNGSIRAACVRARGAHGHAGPAEAAERSRVTRTLADVAAEAADCTKCRLASGRTQVVFGVGNPDADLLFVGEAPGSTRTSRASRSWGRRDSSSRGCSVRCWAASERTCTSATY